MQKYFGITRLPTTENELAVTTALRSLYSTHSSVFVPFYHSMIWRGTPDSVDLGSGVLYAAFELDGTFRLTVDFTKFSDLTLKARKCMLVHVVAHILLGHFDPVKEKTYGKYPKAVIAIAKDIAANEFLMNLSDKAQLEGQIQDFFYLRKELEGRWPKYAPYSYAAQDYLFPPDKSTEEYCELLMNHFMDKARGGQQEQQEEQIPEKQGSEEQDPEEAEAPQDPLEALEKQLKDMSVNGQISEDDLRADVDSALKTVPEESLHSFDIAEAASDAMEEEAAREIMRQFLNKMNEATDGELFRQAGNMAAEFETYVEALNAPMPIELDEIVFRQNTSNEIGNNFFRRTRMRRSIRHPEVRGYKACSNSTWVVAVDTSGSMQLDQLSTVHPIITGLLRRGADVYQAQGDADVSLKLVQVRPGETVEEFFGRGGTCFSPLFEHIQKTSESTLMHIDSVLFITDGYNGDTEEFMALPQPRYEVVIGLAPDGMAPNAFFERCPGWIKRDNIRTVRSVIAKKEVA